MTATIAIPEKVRDRLKTFGTAGMTYPQILTKLMNEVDREAFVRDVRRIIRSTPEEDWIDLDDL